MFCKNCGQAIEEGESFCRACGTAVSTAAGAAAVEAAAEAPAPVTPPPVTPPPTPIPPPPSFVAPAPPPPPVTPGVEAGWRPPQGPADRKGRGGLIAGIVVAALIVLAGIGVGVYFGFIRGGENGGTGSTVTTVGGSTTSSSASTSSSAGTTTTVPGASTTQTIPSLTTTPSGPASTVTTADQTEAYLSATDQLVADLEADDARIPELATEINKTAPNVPTSVRDELQSMLDTLGTDAMKLTAYPIPAGFNESHNWLDQADTHMANRIDATIQGIEAMWNTGKVSSADSYFNTGRAERDAYRAAMQKYYDTVPID